MFLNCRNKRYETSEQGQNLLNKIPAAKRNRYLEQKYGCVYNYQSTNKVSPKKYIYYNKDFLIFQGQPNQVDMIMLQVRHKTIKITFTECMVQVKIIKQ